MFSTIKRLFCTGSLVVSVDKLSCDQQAYRTLDPIRVQNLADVFLERHSNFYTPVCLMLRNSSNEDFLTSTQEEKVMKANVKAAIVSKYI